MRLNLSPDLGAAGELLGSFPSHTHRAAQPRSLSTEVSPQRPLFPFTSQNPAFSAALCSAPGRRGQGLAAGDCSVPGQRPGSPGQLWVGVCQPQTQEGQEWGTPMERREITRWKDSMGPFDHPTVTALRTPGRKCASVSPRFSFFPLFALLP